jgi:hypothetical protein
MSAENARSTQGVKIHTSASAKRDDKSAIRTKMQPSGVPSSPAGTDERRPSHTRKAATRTAAPRLQRRPGWRAERRRLGDVIPLGNRALRVIGKRVDDADQPPVLIVEEGLLVARLLLGRSFSCTNLALLRVCLQTRRSGHLDRLGA